VNDLAKYALIEDAGEKVKHFNVIRNCIPTKEKSRPVYLRDVTELINEFNEFFTSVGARAAAESKKLASVNALPAYKAPSAKTIFQLEEFRFHAVTIFEVRKIVASFPSNRAPGMDKLHHECDQRCPAGNTDRAYEKITFNNSFSICLEKICSDTNI